MGRQTKRSARSYSTFRPQLLLLLIAFDWVCLHSGRQRVTCVPPFCIMYDIDSYIVHCTCQQSRYALPTLTARLFHCPLAVLTVFRGAPPAIPSLCCLKRLQACGLLEHSCVVFRSYVFPSKVDHHQPINTVPKNRAVESYTKLPTPTPRFLKLRRRLLHKITISINNGKPISRFITTTRIIRLLFRLTRITYI
jgi:hypothetical protein